MFGQSYIASVLLSYLLREGLIFVEELAVKDAPDIHAWFLDHIPPGYGAAAYDAVEAILPHIFKAAENHLNVHGKFSDLDEVHATVASLAPHLQ